MVCMCVYFSQDPEILQTQSNVILTAIVHGMKKEEPRWVLTLSVWCLLFHSCM